MRYLSLAGLLFAFWIALSGHYTPALVTAGAVSAVVCLLAAIRMRVADAEGHPVELFRGTLTYYPWLSVEIAKSAWAERHHGPVGFLARPLPTGTMAFWTTVMLAAYLVLSYL